jgi:hypothetical protein
VAEPNAIIEQLAADRNTLRKLNPVSSGHTAVVYLTKQGRYEVGSSRLTHGELWLRTPKEVYQVDVAPHQESIELQLPSMEEAFTFTAKVRVTWRVADPVAAVAGRLTNPLPFIGSYLEERLREVTRGYEVEHSADAERRINLHYGDRAIEVSKAVVVSRCTVVLVLDDATREHIANRTLAGRLQERERYDHDLELLRAKHKRELETAQEQHELQLKEQRMRFYADALRTDDLNVLALRLAGHTEDVNDVINLIMQQKRLEFEGANTVLNQLLDANLVNRKDVAAIMANASSIVIDKLRGVSALGIGKADQQPAVSGPIDLGPMDQGDEEDE